MRSFSGLLLTTTLATIFSLPTFGNAPAVEQTDDSAQERLTPTERRAVRKLVAKFRRARRSLEEQAAVLAEAMQTHPSAVEDIRGSIEQQLLPAVTKYRQDFFTAAAGLAEAKFQQANLNEIATLQQQVNALRDDPNLSKDKIKQQGDPAMERLAEIALVDREDVFASNAKLIDRRQALMPAGKLWEVADAYLTKLAPADGEDAAKAITFDDYLKQEEDIAVRLALPMSNEHRAVLSANEQLAKKLDPEEAKCVLSLNLTRILLGLDPLLVDLKLTAAARDHSHDMREHKFFAHESPVPGKKTPWDRAANFGTKASGENIAAGYGTGPAVNLGWFHSPGHHKNMLGNHRTVGVGREAKHWTQLFGKG